MQISRATQTELGLLITGLRAISVMGVDDVRRKLLIQLENELLTRTGKIIGNPEDQERTRAAVGEN